MSGVGVRDSIFSQITSLNELLERVIFTLSNAKHGERIVIGLTASSTSKAPQIKTTEPMV